MTTLQAALATNTLLDWLMAGGIFLGVTAALASIRLLLLRTLESKHGAAAFAVVVIRHTRYVFLALIGADLGIRQLTLPAPPTQVLDTILVITLLLQIAWWGHGIVNFWIRRVIRRRAVVDAGSTSAIGALGVVLRLTLWVLIMLAVIAKLGVNVATLIAGLGIGGIAIALAVQNIVGDLFASVSIIVDKPFVVGDFIQVGQQLGTVDQIGLKTTRLRSLSGEQLIFGNGDLLKSRIQNYKRMQERRIVFTIGIEYGTPRKAVEAIPGMIRAAIQMQPKIRIDRVHFKEFGDSALTYEAVYFVLSPDYNQYMDIQQAINFTLYRTFEEAGIGFAFPTRTVFVKLASDDAERVAAATANGWNSITGAAKHDDHTPYEHEAIASR